MWPFCLYLGDWHRGHTSRMTIATVDLHWMDTCLWVSSSTASSGQHYIERTTVLSAISPWSIRQICPHPLLWNHGSGHLTSAQLFMIREHYIVWAGRWSHLCRQTASPAMEVCRRLRQLAVSIYLYGEFRPDSLSHSKVYPRSAAVHPRAQPRRRDGAPPVWHQGTGSPPTPRQHVSFTPARNEANLI